LRYLDESEANVLLSRISAKIGTWGQIADANDKMYDASEWIMYRAPAAAHELCVLARHIARWIPRGEWTIFRIDNSTSLRPYEAFALGRLLAGQNGYNWLKNRTVLFASESNGDVADEEMLSSCLIHLFLLFEAHGQLVSSTCPNGKCLSLQDGYAYFKSRDPNDLAEARSLLKVFAAAPLEMPWLAE
jgi:hypothetical protein